MQLMVGARIARFIGCLRDLEVNWMISSRLCPPSRVVELCPPVIRNISHVIVNARRQREEKGLQFTAGGTKSTNMTLQSRKGICAFGCTGWASGEGCPGSCRSARVQNLACAPVPPPPLISHFGLSLAAGQINKRLLLLLFWTEVAHFPRWRMGRHIYESESTVICLSTRQKRKNRSNPAAQNEPTFVEDKYCAAFYMAWS